MSKDSQTDRDDPGGGGLEVANLQFLDWSPISFSVPAGHCLGITGPSGSGKSLLLRSVADLDPHSGEVSLGSIRQEDQPGHLWRRKVGLLPADPQWWHDRVGPHFRNLERMNGQLRRLGFESDVGGWPVSRLSAGEKQRLALLRLIEKRPVALLLDEPTANLDSANAGTVESLLQEYRMEHRVPMIWVSHDRAQLDRLADAVCRMDGRQLKWVSGSNDRLR